MSRAGQSSTRGSASRVANIRIAHSLAQVRGNARRTAWILCPWQAHLPGERGVWLSVLAAHDANAALLDALPPCKKLRPDVYAAVFAVDALRTSIDLIQRVKDAGVAGVINLPSVSFIDGEAGAIFDSLSLGVDREIQFLEICAKEGLRIAGVVNSARSAERLLAAGTDFLVTHSGPPLHGDLKEHASNQLEIELETFVRTNGIPATSVLQLVRTKPHSPLSLTGSPENS